MKHPGAWLALVSLLWACAAPSAVLAYDDCYRDCMDASGCWSVGSDSSSAYCSDTQARCSSTCLDEGRSSPAKKGKSYGAIAYSKKTGAYGYSYGWSSRKKAEKTALDNCRKNGKGCKSIVWFHDSCAAVVSDGKVVTWGKGSTHAQASREAMDRCTKRWFKGRCEEAAYACSG